MKRIIFLLTLVLAMATMTVCTPTFASDVPAPDYLITADDMLKSQGWIKNGSAFVAGEGDNTAYQFVPSGVVSNGFAFVVDIPLEKANYVVVRQYTNLVANANTVIYSHDSTFDYTKQYGSTRHENKADERVVLFDMTSVAKTVSEAGEKSVKYVKITPWDGQKWEPAADKAIGDYYYNLYSVAFFADQKDANATPRHSRSRFRIFR